MAGSNQIGVEVVAVGIAAFSRAMRTAQDDLERTAHSITKASGATAGFGTALTSLGGNMQRVGRAMLIDVTAPLGILTGALINAGIQFEDAFAGIGKTVEGVSVGFDEIKAAAQRDLGITITTMDEARQAAAQMGMAFGDLTPVGQQVREEFRQMALEIPMSAQELANLGEVVGQLGVNAPEIANVTKLVAELGLTTNMSSEDAAMGLIRMANIMRSTVGPDAISMTEFIQRAGSALVDLGNKSVATESEILNFALRLSAAGDMANMSEQEVLAWSTTLADLGARAESGGTAVSRALENMIIAVQSGSKELDLFAGVMGMTGAEFTKIFREDASSALGTFTQKLKEGLEAGKVNKDMLTAMGLGGIRAFDILGRLGNAQEILAKNTNNANKAWADAVALENEAEKRFGTFKSQLQLLKNTFVDLGISIFDLVEDDLKVLVGWIKDAINWFKSLDTGLQKNIVIFAAVAAVIGPLLIVFGGLISILGTAATAITAIGSAALPVIGILGALAAAVGIIGGFDFLKNQPKIPEVKPPTTQTIPETQGDTVQAAEDVADATQEAADAAKEDEYTWVKITRYQATGTQGLLNAAQQAAQGTSDMANAANQIAASSANLETTLQNMKPVTVWVKVKKEKTEEELRQENVGANAPRIMETPAPMEPGKTSLVFTETPMEKGWREFLTFLQVDIPEAIANLKTTLQPFTDLLSGIVTKDLVEAWDSLKVAWDNLSVSAGPLLDSLKEILPVIGVALVAVLTLVILFVANVIKSFAAAAENIGTFVNGIGTTLGGIIEFVKGVVNTFVGLFGLIGGAFMYLYEIITGDSKGAAQIFNDVMLTSLDKLVGGVKQIFGGLVQIFEGIFTTISAVVKGFWDQTTTFFTGLWDDVVEIFKGLSDDLIGHSIITDMIQDTLDVFSMLKDQGLKIISDFVTGITAIFSNIKLPSLGSLLGGLTGGAAAPAAPDAGAGGGEPGQPGGEAAPAAMFSVQQITALQQAIVGLQKVWADFGITVSSTLGIVNQTLASLTGVTKNLFTSMATAFTQAFVAPVTSQIILFNATFVVQTTLMAAAWRTVCLGMVKSWLDFVANSLKLLGEFVASAGGEFQTMKDKGSGLASELGQDMAKAFGEGGVANLALDQFGNKLTGLGPKFGKLKSAVAGFVSEMKALLLSICDAAANALGCVTASPELALQHPFELFEKYLKKTDYGNLVGKSMAMPALTDISTVLPNMQGNTTNVDNSVTANVTGLPITTAESVADTMLRTIRMSEVMQGQ